MFVRVFEKVAMRTICQTCPNQEYSSETWEMIRSGTAWIKLESIRSKVKNWLFENKQRFANSSYHRVFVGLICGFPRRLKFGEREGKNFQLITSWSKYWWTFCWKVSMLNCLWISLSSLLAPKNCWHYRIIQFCFFHILQWILSALR